MNITIVNQHRLDKMGGSELQCDLIANGLAERGHSVTYVAVNGNQTIYPVPYTVIPAASKKEDIARTILTSEPDVLYWRYNKNHFLPVAKKIKKKGIPIIFAASSVNDVNPGFFKKSIGIRKKIRELAKSYWHHLGFRYVDAITVNNKDYLNTLHVPLQEFIPNGMLTDVKPFSWEKPYCAWVGSIKQIKRPELFIKLAKEFETSGVDFIMVGEIQEGSYSWIAEPENLPSNFQYLGLRAPEEVNGIFKECLLHIHTCFPEGFPNVFIQAWSQGAPSISFGFDPGGYIEQHHLGVYANERWDVFSQKVKHVIGNPEERLEMGKHAQIFSHNMFTTDMTVRKIEQLLLKVSKVSK